MASADVQAPPPEPAPALPDYLADPNAVLKDTAARWRYGRAPDYSKTRAYMEATKQSSHAAGSLPELVQNLVKNWEVEASFKPQLGDWRTIDHDNYSFSINGGPPQTAEHMLKVGTYNAIIAPNQYYSPENSDFATSHKTFKRMMPHFAWEVLEVFSGPPQVAFRWRHWGVMKNDYVGFNDQGEKVTVKAHGGQIDITGITIAKVNEKVQLQSVETYFDPLEMFRQIAPQGIVNKEIVTKRADAGETSDEEHDTRDEETESTRKAADTSSASTKPEQRSGKPDAPRSLYSSAVNGAEEPRVETAPVAVEPVVAADGSLPMNSEDGSIKRASHGAEEVPAQSTDAIESYLEQPAANVHPIPRGMEEAVKPRPGEAVVASPHSFETEKTYEEMSKMSAMECPFLMNRE